MAGFWVASADPTSGNRISASEERLIVGPADLRWPDTPPGVMLETPNGRLIKQLPTNDGRERAYVWQNLPRYRADIMRLLGRLEGLVASTRRARGLSPWVFLRDTETHKLRRLITYTGTATSAATTVLTDTSQTWVANEFSTNYGVVEIIAGAAVGQRQSITANTLNTLTVQSPFSVAPTGAQYSVQYSRDDWVRVRVTNVIKVPRPRSGLIYDSLTVSFVIDDPVATSADFG